MSPLAPESTGPSASFKGSTMHASSDASVHGSSPELVDDLVQHGAAVAGLNALSPQALVTLIQQLFYGQIKKSGATGMPLSAVANERAEIAIQDAKLKGEQANAERDLERSRLKRDELRDAFAVESAGVRMTDRVGAVLGGAIWIAVTVYLYCFYLNVGFNALMFEPLTDRSMARLAALASAALINPQALGRALHSPTLLFYPAAMLTLGFLLHWLWGARKRAAVIGILLLTLAFDAFLASEIVRKIHLVQYAMGEVGVEWAPGMEFQQTQFYLVLCLGFGTYVAWGLLTGHLLGLIGKMQLGAVKPRLMLAEEEYERLQQGMEGFPARRMELDRRRKACEGAFDRFRLDVASVLEGFQRAIAAQWAHESAHHAALVQEIQRVGDRERERLEGLAK